jgi:hypothetical protein
MDRNVPSIVLTKPRKEIGMIFRRSALPGSVPSDGLAMSSLDHVSRRALLVGGSAIAVALLSGGNRE